MRTYYNDNHYQLYLRIDERKEKKKSKTKVNQNTKRKPILQFGNNTQKFKYPVDKCIYV